jgi:hypothetical protein
MRQIITDDLGMRKISAKIVLRILRDDQECQLHISSDILHNAEMSDWSLPAMKCGVSNTTQKQNAGACNGKHRIHLGREKHAYLAHSFKTMLVRFFDHKGTMNSLHKDEW